MPRACPVPCVKDFRQLRQELQVYRREWRRSRTPSGVQGVRGCWWPWSSRTACTPDGVRVSLVSTCYTPGTPDGVRGGCYNRLKMSLATNVKQHGASPWHRSKLFTQSPSPWHLRKTGYRSDQRETPRDKPQHLRNTCYRPGRGHRGPPVQVVAECAMPWAEPCAARGRDRS